MRIHGANLRIQIKAYWIKREVMDELMKCGVIPLSLRQTDTYARVRALTKKAVHRFENFHKNFKKPHVKKQKTDPWNYYRAGKKHASDPQKNRW